MYRGANQEFLSAHAHYRSGKRKECLADCLKALESTLKAICDKRRWGYATNATAAVLFKVVFESGLVPPFLEAHFTGLRSALEAGVPPIRNRLAGHGQGPTPISVPDSIAGFALHSTASAIVFLARAEQELG